MQKYKITASKSQKKYQFVLNAENEKLAKEKIHKDGYSILSVELFDDINTSNNAFIFEGEKDDEIKKWKVLWNDIFKIYLKLREWVWYRVLKLYSTLDKEKSEEYKINILKDLEEQYDLYKNINKKSRKEEKIKEAKFKKVDKNEINIDNFYLKKELEDTYKLIDFVLNKLKILLSSDKYELSDIKKERLKELYNNLVKIKTSTNISKLKELWEAVLLKIWKIELEVLEKFKDNESQNFLKETNKLLKQIWSDKKFIEESRDLKKQFQNFIWTMKETLIVPNEKKDINKKTTGLKGKDIKTHTYLKNRIFLNKYKQKLKENNIEILKNIIVFILPFWKSEEIKQGIIVKRKVIKQNIYLFRAKIDWKAFSYTKTLKGLNYILDAIFGFFVYIKDYLFFVVLLYSLLFLLFLNLSYYNIITWLESNINYYGIFYFIIFLFIYFTIYFSRWVYSLIFNSILLFFIFMFWIINF